MKKAFITLCVIMMTTVTVFAGGDEGKTRYYAPQMNQGWFVDVAGTYSIFAGNNCTYYNPTTYYGWGDANVGLTARFGRRVGPNTAIRLAYDWHLSENQDGPFNFKSLHFDFMESPIDLFYGYNPGRFYTMWLYGGIGLMGYDRAENRPFLIHWDSNLEFGIHTGIMNNFRINNSLDFHVDLTSVVTRWSYDAPEFDNVNLLHRAHIDFTAMAGIMWYIGGRSLEVVEFEETDCSEQEGRINELEEQIDEFQRQLANCGQGLQIVHDTIYKTITVDGKPVTYPFSVFFNKGSYDFRDGRDRINMQEVAQAAIDHELIITLTGTCDAGTASSAFNKTLAENRCNKVKAELVKMGVPSENIIINAVGGVNKLKPAEYDRRVVIEFSEKE